MPEAVAVSVGSLWQPSTDFWLDKPSVVLDVTDTGFLYIQTRGLTHEIHEQVWSLGLACDQGHLPQMIKANHTHTITHTWSPICHKVIGA